MTDSDTSPAQFDSKGGRVSSIRKFHKNNHTSSSNFNKEGSSSTLSHPIDADEIVFLSSCQVVRDVVHKFDAQKKELVNSIGFGGILQLPNLTFEDNSFSLWLLRNLHCSPKCIIIGDNVKLTISAEHVGKISGLNHTGIDVSEKHFRSSSEKNSFMHSKLAFLHTETDIVQAAQSFVQAPSPQKPSQIYSDNFMVAFVIFVMGRFLAPGENFAVGNCDFWGALESPQAISCYNWSSYVLSHILESACTLELDIVRNQKISPIACCHLILQVFYLDNIDFGTFNLMHTVFPRVKHYSNDTMSRMIECDRCNDNDMTNTTSFGRLKMLRNFKSCYNACSNPGTVIPPSASNLSLSTYGVSNTSTPLGRIVSIPDHTLSVNHHRSNVELPLIASYVPSHVSQATEMTSFVNQNSNSTLKAELLEAIRAHQERCSNYVQSFTKGLVEAIGKENSSLASWVADCVNRNQCVSTPSPLCSRRIGYSETPDVHDNSSSSGVSRIPKIRRIDNSQLIDCVQSRSDQIMTKLEIGQQPSVVRSKSQLNKKQHISSNVSLSVTPQQHKAPSVIDSPTGQIMTKIEIEHQHNLVRSKSQLIKDLAVEFRQSS